MSKTALLRLARTPAAGLALLMASPAPAQPGSGQDPPPAQQAVPQQLSEYVYGAELMSEDELVEFRTQLEQLTTPESRAALRLEHRRKMDLRARERGVKAGQEEGAAGRAAPGSGGGVRPLGWELMDEAERRQYRGALRALETREERAAFRAEHRRKMEARAEQQGVELVPRAEPGSPGPGRPVYGQKLMAPEELAAYREKLAGVATPEARRELQQRHVQEMQRRAAEQGIELPPPGARTEQPPQRAGGPPPASP